MKSFVDMPHRTSEKCNRIFGGGRRDFAFRHSCFAYLRLITHLDVASFPGLKLLVSNSWLFHFSLFFAEWLLLLVDLLVVHVHFVTFVSKLKPALTTHSTNQHDNREPNPNTLHTVQYSVTEKEISEKTVKFTWLV